MLKNLNEFGKSVEITGFRNVRIPDPKSFVATVQKNLPGGTEIQLFDADLVVTWQHLYFAALNALTAFQNKYNLSKSLAVETVLYASAQRQIKKALELIGVKPDSRNVAALIIGNDVDLLGSAIAVTASLIGAGPDDDVLELTEGKVQRIRKAYDISDLEIQTTSANGDVNQALVDLIIERVALLSTRL